MPYGTTEYRAKSRRAASVALVGSALVMVVWVAIFVGMALAVLDEDKGTSRRVVALCLALSFALLGCLLVRKLYRMPSRER